MTRLGQILAGWTMTIGAVIAACFAFPAISEQAAAHKDSARWQARAQAFQLTSLPDEHYVSPIAGQLMNDLEGDETNPFARDAQLLTAGKASVPEILKWSKEKMSTHRCMAEAVYYEARSELKAGQKAVAEVVLNRVKSKHYPNTICGVVYQGAERSTGCQFSFTCDGSTAKAPYGRYWESSKAIATLAMTGTLTPLTKSATHYHTTWVNPHWAPNLRKTRLIGSHQFYRFKFRERRSPSTATIAVAPPI